MSFSSFSSLRTSCVPFDSDSFLDRFSLKFAKRKPLRHFSSTVSMASLSKRIQETDEPIIVLMRELMKGKSDVMSLGQGIVYWRPPDKALKIAESAIHDPVSSNYGIDDGMIELRNALVEKVKKENNLLNSSIMVTAGANQAFVNVVVSICDPGDSVVLFVPYYFNHKMAFQMSGVSDIISAPTHSHNLLPDEDWLEKTFEAKNGNLTPKVIVIVNPGNPTGVVVPGENLKRISNLCKKHNAWFVVDNTYEYFMYDGRNHECVEGNHVINIFSFSKAYGLMGWRVGYIAYPNGCPNLAGGLLKAQDTIPICANLIGQQAALASLEGGREWVEERVQTLYANRSMAMDALSPLGPDAIKGGEGAIYLWARLPAGFSDDLAVVKWLIAKFGVGVIPGSASGANGYLRIAFANLKTEDYALACERLKRGLEHLVRFGMD